MNRIAETVALSLLPVLLAAVIAVLLPAHQDGVWLGAALAVPVILAGVAVRFALGTDSLQRVLQGVLAGVLLRMFGMVAIVVGVRFLAEPVVVSASLTAASCVVLACLVEAISLARVIAPRMSREAGRA